MDSGKKKFQATSNAGSLAILHSKFPELSVSLSGNESDDEEDDFIDDELTGEDFAPVFEGMLSLKDFEEGDWLDCSGTSMVVCCTTWMCACHRISAICI